MDSPEHDPNRTDLTQQGQGTQRVGVEPCLSDRSRIRKYRTVSVFSRLGLYVHEMFGTRVVWTIVRWPVRCIDPSLTFQYTVYEIYVPPYYLIPVIPKCFISQTKKTSTQPTLLYNNEYTSFFWKELVLLGNSYSTTLKGRSVHNSVGTRRWLFLSTPVSFFNFLNSVYIDMDINRPSFHHVRVFVRKRLRSIPKVSKCSSPFSGTILSDL